MDDHAAKLLFTNLKRLGGGKIGKMVSGPFVEPEILELTGFIVVMWGELDLKLLEFTRRLIETTSEPDYPRWETSPFNKRQTLFLQKIREQFVDEPNIIKWFERFVSELSAVQADARPSRTRDFTNGKHGQKIVKGRASPCSSTAMAVSMLWKCPCIVIWRYQSAEPAANSASSFTTIRLFQLLGFHRKKDRRYEVGGRRVRAVLPTHPTLNPCRDHSEGIVNITHPVKIT